MAHFDRVKPGGWVLNEVLDQALMNELDTNVSKALNGDEGGTWAPSTEIVIGGSGLRLTTLLKAFGGLSVQGGDLAVSQDAAVDGNVDVGGNLSVTGTTNVASLFANGTGFFNGGLTVAGNIAGVDLEAEDITAQTLHLTGVATIDTDLTVGDDLYVNDDLTVGDDAIVGGDCTVAGLLTGGTFHGLGAAVFDGLVTLNDNLNLNGLLVSAGGSQLSGGVQLAGSVTGSWTQTGKRTKSSGGRDIERVTKMPSDANQTISFSSTDLYFVPSGLLSTPRVLALDDVNAEDGATITVRNEDNTHDVTISANGGAFTMSLRWATGLYMSATLVYVNALGWRLIARSPG